MANRRFHSYELVGGILPIMTAETKKTKHLIQKSQTISITHSRSLQCLYTMCEVQHQPMWGYVCLRCSTSNTLFQRSCFSTKTKQFQFYHIYPNQFDRYSLLIHISMIHPRQLPFFYDLFTICEWKIRYFCLNFDYSSSSFSAYLTDGLVLTNMALTLSIERGL